MPGHLPARPGPAFAWPVLLALMVMLAGCVRLVSNYDETLDRQLTAYAEKSDKFLLRMGRLAGTPEGTYGQNAGYYDDARGDLSTMRICTASGCLDNRLRYAARLKVSSCQAARIWAGLRYPFFSISHSAL